VQRKNPVAGRERVCGMGHKCPKYMCNAFVKSSGSLWGLQIFCAEKESGCRRESVEWGIRAFLVASLLFSVIFPTCMEQKCFLLPNQKISHNSFILLFPMSLK
jgi:hypothetical protein